MVTGLKVKAAQIGTGAGCEEVAQCHREVLCIHPTAPTASRAGAGLRQGAPQQPRSSPTADNAKSTQQPWWDTSLPMEQPSTEGAHSGTKQSSSFLMSVNEQHETLSDESTVLHTAPALCTQAAPTPAFPQPGSPLCHVRGQSLGQAPPWPPFMAPQPATTPCSLLLHRPCPALDACHGK